MLDEKTIDQFKNYCDNLYNIFNYDNLVERTAKLTINVFNPGIIGEIDELNKEMEKIKGGVEQKIVS